MYLYWDENYESYLTEGFYSNYWLSFKVPHLSAADWLLRIFVFE